MERSKTKDVIGPSVEVSLERGPEKVPAKIDTGARTSALWASDVEVKPDGTLEYRLFAPGSPLYSGELRSAKDYTALVVRSAMGQEQIRYSIPLSVTINGRKIRSHFTLADRSKNSFPILIGKNTLRGKFIVDVSLPGVKVTAKPKERNITDEFKKNPYQFHQKYLKKGAEK